jgi:predicted oxidoreductase
MTVLRHEQAHLLRHDNLTRAGLIALPDLLAFTQIGREISSHWHKAVEEAADDDAVRADTSARLALADTLVRVGRMAGEKPPSWMPALALFDGDSLERRVRRLLDPEPLAASVTPLRSAGAALAGLAATVAVAGFAIGSRPLHDVMEWAVRNLP